MDEKEIRKILKEETVIPDNIDRAMEDVLKGILDHQFSTTLRARLALEGMFVGREEVVIDL